MTKAEVVAAILQNTKDMDKTQVLDVLENFFDVVKDKMATGENVYIRGFGSFVTKKRAQKIAQNITKKEPVVIPAHYVPVFKPAQEFLEKVKTLKVEPEIEDKKSSEKPKLKVKAKEKVTK